MEKMGKPNTEVMNMPGNKEPVFSWRDGIAKLIGEAKKVSMPVFAAAGLLLLSAGMTYIVVVSLQENTRPLPPLASQVSSVELPQEIGSDQGDRPKDRLPAVTEAKPAVEVTAIGEPSRTTVKIAPQGQVIKEFGWHHDPLYKDWRFHSGIDITAPSGQPVKAIASGQVLSVRTDPQFGLTVTVKSGDYTIDYGSLSESAVTPGTAVSAGSPVGKAGESPGEPYPHLHFAIKKEGKFVDPRQLRE